MRTTTPRSTRITRRRRDHAPSPTHVREAVAAEREPSFLLAKPEKRLLQAIARRLPSWVLPNDLTALGVVAAAGIAVAYALSNGGNGWLWAASALLVLHWLGDSLDGTLARVRGIGRPRYGYYLDHLVDAIATAMIGIGLGLSPHMLLSVGTLLVVAYLVLSINVYLESQAVGRFSIGYGLLGPSEARVGLIALNSALALGLDLRTSVAGMGITVLDVAGIALAVAMLAALAIRARGNLRELAIAEPGAKRWG
jgi:phosphatidylglycerophosphate synthase